MATKSITLNTLIMVLVLVGGTECLAWISLRVFRLEPLMAMAAFRVIQAFSIIMVVGFLEDGLATIGWSPAQWPHGLRLGAIWSAVFGLVALAGLAAATVFGVDALAMLRAPLPNQGTDRVLFFLVGGFIAPITEELCFRGIIYTFFRKWGVLIALLASTTVFVLLHSISGIPVTQIVGGIVFALAYERTQNLMVPMVIHITGNMAIFSLSLPGALG